jgi:hypothetical protein
MNEYVECVIIAETSKVLKGREDKRLETSNPVLFSILYIPFDVIAKSYKYCLYLMVGFNCEW